MTLILRLGKRNARGRGQTLTWCCMTIVFVAYKEFPANWDQNSDSSGWIGYVELICSSCGCGGVPYSGRALPVSQVYIPLTKHGSIAISGTNFCGPPCSTRPPLPWPLMIDSLPSHHHYDFWTRISENRGSRDPFFSWCLTMDTSMVIRSLESIQGGSVGHKNLRVCFFNRLFESRVWLIKKLHSRSEIS